MRCFEDEMILERAFFEFGGNLFAIFFWIFLFLYI